MFILDKLHEAVFGKKPKIVPAEGYTMQPKPEAAWADSPLSPSELSRAKILLAQKLDTHWEDR